MSRLLARAVRGLLPVFPPHVRREFGPEIESLVMRTWEDEQGRRGPVGRGSLALRLIANTFFSAIAFRVDPLRRVRLLPRGLHMRALGYDLRFAVRSLTKAPGFTITAVAVLAIGLAICTAVFTVAEHLLIRPLPYAQPDRLVMLWDARRDAPHEHNVVAPGNIADWRAQSRAMSHRVTP